MTFEAALDLLRHRAPAVTLGQWQVQAVIDKPSGHPGELVPNRDPEMLRAVIYLRTGRSSRDTLITLCHELGHFWSLAAGRRDACYFDALVSFTKWQSSLSSEVRNAPDVLASRPGSPEYDLAYSRSLEASLANRPNPLSERQKTAIVSEESLAWCFALRLASALRVPTGEEFEADARKAVETYCSRTHLAGFEWGRSRCVEYLNASADEFIASLVTPGSER